MPRSPFFKALVGLRALIIWAAAVVISLMVLVLVITISLALTGRLIW